MSKILHLDYETFSPVNLRVAGLYKYASHPKADMLCASWAVDDCEPLVWSDYYLPAAKEPLLRMLGDQSVKIHAFNALFERRWTRWLLEKLKLKFRVDDSRWVDTMAISRMCAMPGSLERCAEALKVPMQKDKDGKRLIDIFCKLQRSGIRIMPKDRPDEFKKLMRYCMQDVRTDRAVAKALPVHELPTLERKVWVEDAIINERGVPIDREMAEGAVAMRAEARLRACKQVNKMTNGAITSIGQTKAIQAFAAKLGFPLANLKKETLQPMFEADEEGEYYVKMPDLLRDVLELRAGNNLTSLAKYSKMLTAVDEDGRIRGVHQYHTATTGRWSGCIVQFHNLPRPAVKLDALDHELIRHKQIDILEMLYGNVMTVLRDALRNTVRASKGKMLFVVDKSAIEARVLGFISDCQGYAKAYKEGLDLYKVTASVIFAVPYDEVTDDQRWLGKCMVLGLGYGMGEKTFWDNCKKNGRTLDHSLTKKAVKIYRDHYHEIPDLWHRTENACVRAIRNPGTVHTLGHGIRVVMVGKHLTIALPSGRRLWYPFATIKEEMNKFGKLKPTICFWTEKNKKWVPWGRTYGGRLVENIVQAIARDLLAEALLKCECQKLDPIMHIHDEVVGDVDPTKHNINEMHKIFRTAPTWAVDLLLGSGGFVSPFYKK